MKPLTAAIIFGASSLFATPNVSAIALPLRPLPTAPQTREFGIDRQLWDTPDRAVLLQAIAQSLRYIDTPSAERAYRNYPVPGVTRDRVRRSLQRFRELLISANTPEELHAALAREFVFYQAAGRDNAGTVAFTGYFEPIYAASRTPTAEYRYPLYGLPQNFSNWSRPHPTRLQLEGRDGTGNNSRLAGLELVWLRDRFEAFLVHVQGSARLQLTDGSTMSVGYAGKTDRPYSSVGKALVDDKKLPREGLTLPVLIDYFRRFPNELERYLPQNQSFIFFRETNGAPPTGSLSLPVSAERSIATDKSLMPPGALALIHTRIPYFNEFGELETPLVSRYVLDQDTGSAIRGAGRVDIFMGTGVEAGDRAGVIDWTGELYYLLLKQ